MVKRMSFATLFLVLLLVATPVLAQGPINPQHSDPTWTASYWNNMSLSGTPALTRQEANVNYNWGTGSPDGSVAADQFSARWTRYIDVTPSTYRFAVTSDDGIRLWIDEALVLDKWYEHPAQTFTVDQYLGAGHHLIKLEYYENGGEAVAQLSWSLATQPSGPWRAEYFNNMTISGSPALVRNENDINYNWGTGAPASGVNADHFSVRWTRTIDLPAQMHRFTLTSDDGARLWVNGHLLIDAWYDQAATRYTGDIYLPGGNVTIELQYYENAGHAVAQLSWGTPGSGPVDPNPNPAAVIVDDLDTGFVKGGGGWRTAAEGYNGHLTWALNNNTTNYNYAWGRWYPKLEARRYEVYVYIPERYTTTSQARYWIMHADGYTLRVVDQSTTGGRWVSLGTYRFRGDGSDYVSLADVTFEAYHSRLVAFDAVKWEPR